LFSFDFEKKEKSITSFWHFRLF